MKRPRYRIAEFVVSPSQRRVLRAGREVPLIPRYFDLLLMLLERRGEAVSRREILDVVWSDVVVTDNALNQAIRHLRRIFGDDSRSPTFIVTVPRHGYRFAHPDVKEEADVGMPIEGPAELPPDPARPAPVSESEGDRIDAALEVLLRPGEGAENARARREAAEQLHRLGTEEALARLGGRPGQEAARALLRDARWTFPEAGPVPVLGTPGALRTASILIGQRLRQALSVAGRRWGAATLGGAVAGLVAGAMGALPLRFGPGSTAGDAVLLALPMVGLAIGAAGAAGVGAGLAFCEAVFRSWRGLALPACGALGGLLVGALTHGAAAVLLTSLFGTDLSPVAGGSEGLAIGAAVGLGYALATPLREGGMATPRGSRRALAALYTGLVCAVITVLLAASGHFLGAMSLDLLTQRFPDGQVGLAPLARIIGDDPPGRATAMVVSAWEGLWFGAGVVAGLTHRPSGVGSAEAEEG